jgi:hypothetical protein
MLRPIATTIITVILYATYAECDGEDAAAAAMAEEQFTTRMARTRYPYVQIVETAMDLASGTWLRALIVATRPMQRL